MAADDNQISRKDAIELARAKHDEKWRPVPGYPAGDTMATSYRAERYIGGWLFVPAVAGLERDPKLAEHYPYYVVEDSGDAWLGPYASGRPV